MFTAMNLRTKMLVAILSVVLLAFLVTNVYILMVINKDAKVEAIEKGQESAYKYSSEIKAGLDKAFGAARTLAITLEGLKQIQDSNRKALERMLFRTREINRQEKVIIINRPRATERYDIDKILRKLLEDNPQFLGVWTCWEPGALDGKDASYAGTAGHDRTGRYVPYWNREQGTIRVRPLTNYDIPGKGDYYLIPKKTRTEAVIGPSFRKLNGKDVLVATFAVPIINNRRFLGVAGIDITLENIQKNIAMIRPFNTGYAGLIAYEKRPNNPADKDTGSQGFYVANISPDWVGKEVSDPETIAGCMQALQSNSIAVISDNTDSISKTGVTRIMAPVQIGSGKTTWVFEMVIPMDQALKKINELSNITIIFGVITLIIIILVVLMITNSVLNPLRGIIGSLNQGASQISEVSEKLNEFGTQLSLGNALQASAIEESSATLQESTAMLQQNNANTMYAAQLSEQAKESADKGSVEMREMMDSILEIKKSSDQIVKIIKVIDDIAFQTNILSLNAAIEAARAGEAGLGFAVVAEEVRNLAQRSAQAAKDTTAMIENNIELSGKGVAVARKVQDVLMDIVSQAKKVSELMDEISAASQEQYQGVEQVNSAMSQMESTILQNTANADESAKIAEKLSVQSENLKAVVTKLSLLVNGGKVKRG